MPRFEVRQSANLNLTTYSGLALIGQCCEAAQVEMMIDPRLLNACPALCQPQESLRETLYTNSQQISPVDSLRLALRI